VIGPWGWALADVRLLADPIPWKGAQGLRHLPEDVASQVEAQIAESTWSGRCVTGKHGLDYEGQACDLCAGAA
jgi:hypothetical protein